MILKFPEEGKPREVRLLKNFQDEADAPMVNFKNHESLESQSDAKKFFLEAMMDDFPFYRKRYFILLKTAFFLIKEDDSLN